MTLLSGLDRDWRLRLAAFDRLEQIRKSGAGADFVRSSDLADGFEFEGERIRFTSPQRGIWKPRQADGALSVLTAPPRPGQPAPYDDKIEEDVGFFSYKYEGTDPNLSTNIAVRRAMEWGRPLIYFVGESKGIYQAFFPTYITNDSPESLTFRLEVDSSIHVLDPTHSTVAERAPAREYATRSVKVRIHQRRFRQLVVGAYRKRCAICQLRHESLLDAAHILEDRHERGLPEIPNGLSLCKIHHSAYDVNILGVDPDYRVHVRQDVLRERDGPMLMWGLQKMDGVTLSVPKPEAHQPNREFLEQRFARFLAI